MPPRSKTEVLVTTTPASLSSFYDEKVIEQILQLFANKDEFSLIALTAMTLGADDYLVNLKQQIIVDSRLDFLRFCLGQGYSPLKTLHVIKWVEHFQQVAEGGGGVDGLREELAAFVASEIEEGWKWRQAQQAEEVAVEPQHNAKSQGKKGGRVVEKAPIEETEAAVPLCRENIYLTKEDVGPFCTYIMHGIIQHASLYAYAANYEQETGPQRNYSFFLEVPVPAPPLRSSTALEKAPQELSSSTLCDMRNERDVELAALVSECEEAVAKENLWKKVRQIEEEMKLLIENEGTKKAVEETYDSLEIDLARRQHGILQRILVLERKLGLEHPL